MLPGKPCLVLWMNRECELPAELLSLPVILMDDAVNDEEWWPDFLGWLTLRQPTGTICICIIALAMRIGCRCYGRLCCHSLSEGYLRSLCNPHVRHHNKPIQAPKLSQVFDRVIVWISGVVTFTSSNDANLRSDGTFLSQQRVIVSREHPYPVANDCNSLEHRYLV